MIERTYVCDGPNCNAGQPCRTTTASPPPHLPPEVIEVRGVRPEGVDLFHFCGWDCLMKYAATKPLPREVSPEDVLG